MSFANPSTPMVFAILTFGCWPKNKSLSILTEYIRCLSLLSMSLRNAALTSVVPTALPICFRMSWQGVLRAPSPYNNVSLLLPSVSGLIPATPEGRPNLCISCCISLLWLTPAGSHCLGCLYTSGASQELELFESVRSSTSHGDLSTYAAIPAVRL